MYNYYFKNSIKKIILIIFILAFSLFTFTLGICAQKVELTELQNQARLYRNQGLEKQQTGDLEGAMQLYQKAVALDPFYAVAYNDLGIVYEAKGLIDRAEESYLQATKLDPFYLSAYSNLALLYEGKRDLNKAAFYWEKRVKLGAPDDSWTLKAKQRLNDIQLVTEGMGEGAREQEVISLIKDVASQKDLKKKDNKALARAYFEKAKLNYKKGDEVTAFREAINAQQLDPNNKEIQEFITKIQKRLLSK
jgi:superkiller protein 3